MMVFVGLGNPGNEYESTRHNVGFWVVEQLAERWVDLPPAQWQYQPKYDAQICKQGDRLFVKPQTFMNHSGVAVSGAIRFFTDWPVPGQAADQHGLIGQRQPLELLQLYVIHDDLDIPVGRYKLQLGTGPKQHHGLQSVYQYLGTKQFWHVRVGVDGRMGDRSMPPDRYVLQPPPLPERILLDQAITRISNELTHATRL